MEQEMTLDLDIAETVVDTKIGILKSNVETIAERLQAAVSIGNMVEIMFVQQKIYTDFIALRVYNRNGVVAHCGDWIAHDAINERREHAQLVFGGKSILTPPHYNDKGEKSGHAFINTDGRRPWRAGGQR